MKRKKESHQHHKTLPRVEERHNENDDGEGLKFHREKKLMMY
jgi:hypothetical protein